MSRRVVSSLFLLTASIFLSNKSFGQAITGVIVGSVRDASGAIVQGAKIEAKNLDTGAVLSTTSASEGNYTLATVPPGSYDVSAHLAGFSTAISRKAPVEVQKTSRIDFTLSPGSTTEEVVVTAVAPLVQS